MEGPALSLWAGQDTNVVVQWDTKESTAKVTANTWTEWFVNFLGKFPYNPKTVECSKYILLNSTENLISWDCLFFPKFRKLFPVHYSQPEIWHWKIVKFWSNRKYPKFIYTHNAMEHVRSQKLFPIYSYLAPHAVRQLRCLANFRPILSLDDDSFVHSSSASAVSFPSPFIFLFFKYYTFSLLYFQIYLVLVKSWTHIPIDPCISSTERSPCQPDTCANGGTCFETQSGFKCLCQVGYSGKSCSGNSLLLIIICDLPDGRSV